MPLLWELLDEEYDSEVRPHGDDDDDDDDDDSGGGGGGGDDDDDDDQGGGDDPGDQGDPGGGFDWGDNGDNGDQGDNGDSGGGFDYGDNGGGDSGWSSVQDYEDNGRTIRKFTDSSGTDYFQDVGEWGGSSRNNDSSSDFNWGDNNDQGNIFQDHGAREMPDVDPDVRDLHDYFHPYTISKYEDDPVRSKWGDGIASDGTRFDQQDDATRNMFQSSYGDTAPRTWAEQRSRDLEAEFRSRGVVTLPQQQEQEPTATVPALPLLGLSSPTNPDGSPTTYGLDGPPTQYTEYPADAPTPPERFRPAAADAPPETPEAEASPPQPQPPAPPAPPPGQQAAADAAARATMQAGGSPQQVADAAAAAALAYDRRNLSSESLDTQRQFGQAYGDQANERWVQQHNQELALNRALYGTAEPRAGSPQTGQIPGLGDVGPAPDRTIGRAQPAPWNRPAATPPVAPGAAGASPTPAPGLTPGAVSAVTSTTHGLIDDLVRPPSAIYNGASPAQAQAATSTTHGLIDDILQRPGTPATGGPPPDAGPSIDASIRSAANIPNPNTGEVRGPTTPPPPLTGPQAAAYERGGVNPATGDIDVQGTPGMPTQTMHEAGFEPASATIPIDDSIRRAAGLPAPVDPDLGPRESRVQPLKDPLGMLVQRAAEAQGANDVEGFGRNVAVGLAAREAWAEPYANDLARAAWYHESRGLEGGPEQAPASYIADWKGAFLAGDTNVPGVREVSAEMASRGVAPPGLQASPHPTAPPIQANLTKWTTSGSGIPGTSLVPDQFTDPSVRNLPGWQADAACGITAAIGETRALGLDVSPADALAAARRYGGWTARAGMGGTGGEVAMLRQLGVPALDAVRADQSRIDAELAAGRPVIIDTSGSAGIPSGHYFTISGRTEDGRYVVSGSGSALRGGDVVMSRERMEQLTGSWRNAVYLDPAKLPQGGARQAPPQPTMVSAPATTVPMQSVDGAPPSPQANLKPTFTVPETEQMRSRIMTEMPDIQFDPNDGVETRMQKMAPALEWLQKEYGVSAEVMAGMAYNENHLGMANSGAVRGNNLWSVQYMPSDSQSTGPIPEGRWAQYPSIKAALARFVGMYAHPENGYRYTWQGRSDPDKFMQGLDKDKYVVDEPGFPKSDWYTGVNKGRALYRQVRAGQVTTREDPSLGRGG